MTCLSWELRSREAMSGLWIRAVFLASAMVTVSGEGRHSLGMDGITMEASSGRNTLLRNERAAKHRGSDDSALDEKRQGQEERIRELEQEIVELRRALKEVTATAPPPASAAALIDDVRVPTAWEEDGTAKPLSLAERVRYLERKVAGSTNWLRDPQLWRKRQYDCRNLTDMGSHGEHHVCLDGWEKQLHRENGKAPCVVYDLGIRAQPEFGKTLMEQYGCAVRAYDPSPTTAKWWDSKEAERLRAAGPDRYKLHKMAAGGQDGPLELFEYNWQQVSIVKEEDDLTRSKQPIQNQRSFAVESRTLPSMLQENGDTRMNVLKVDIEGSEYMFMQDIFDRMGCPPAGQITLEYHHFSLDERYGSSPEINTIHHLLNTCGFKSFMVRNHWKNHVTPEDPFYISPKRYTLASYCRDCHMEV